MPRISFFYGIAIYMYYQDHAPPHFHAIYGDYEATFDISTGELADGKMPKRAISLVSEWARQHTTELMENWDLARAAEPLKEVDPLD